MDAPQNAAPRKGIPHLCLLTGATVWGLVWYPYRVLEAQGMSGIEASILTYLAALLCGYAVWHRQLRGVRPTRMLLAVGLAAGACNLGYVLATLLGEVTRVLLLFYLSPLWTIFFARCLLGERLSGVGALVIALSLTGAGIMLWNPEQGLPWPAKAAEWLGLAAGILFALSNVLIKKSSDLSIEAKSMSVFVGVLLWSLLVWPFFPHPTWQLRGEMWGVILLIGATLVFTNAVVQYGLTHTRAAQAIVIMLFELVVAAAAAWLLVGETLGLREWLGGGLIISASLLSIRLER